MTCPHPLGQLRLDSNYGESEVICSTCLEHWPLALFTSRHQPDGLLGRLTKAFAGKAEGDTTPLGEIADLKGSQAANQTIPRYDSTHKQMPAQMHAPLEQNEDEERTWGHDHRTRAARAL